MTNSGSRDPVSRLGFLQQAERHPEKRKSRNLSGYGFSA
jgi:hypothetical protein